MEKLLSIIIPIYNVERYLNNCLESILNQDFDNYEIIAINDGSTDKSLELLSQYSYNKKITVFSKKNEGLSVTRNLGINEAKGKYIMFLDSDDYLSNGSLKFLAKDLEKDKNVVIGSYNRVYNDGNVVQVDKELFKLSLEIDQYIKNTTSFSPSVRLIIKKKYLQNNNYKFLEGKLHEDLFWSAQILDNVKNDDVLFTKAVWYNHVQYNKSSITKNLGLKNIMDVFESAKASLPIIYKTDIIDHIISSTFGMIRVYYTLNDFEKKVVENFINQNKNLFKGVNMRYRLFNVAINVLQAKLSLALLKPFVIY